MDDFENRSYPQTNENSEGSEKQSDFSADIQADPQALNDESTFDNEQQPVNSTASAENTPDTAAVPPMQQQSYYQPNQYQQNQYQQNQYQQNQYQQNQYQQGQYQQSQQTFRQQNNPVQSDQYQHNRQPYYNSYQQNNNGYNQPFNNQNVNPYSNQPQNGGPNYNMYGQPINNPYRAPQTPKMVYNPYTGKYEPQQKSQTKTSTIVLISVIAVLLVAFITGLIVFLANRPKNEVSSSDDLFSVPAPGNGEENSPYSDFFSDNDIFSNSIEYETYEAEIELKEDKGESQIHDDDKKGADPDESFKSLKENKIPSDAKTGDYTSETAYNKVSPAVVAIQCFENEISDNKADMVGEGSGTVVSEDGYIITNSHVIGNSKAYALKVVFNDKSSKEAKVVGFDSRTDLAVLKVDATGLKYVTFGETASLKVGEDIIAIGNPGGSTFQNSLTKGIISFVGRELSINDLVDYIQIDASINPGNSGGPLCNIYGQVIGINTAKVASTEYEGMGFAIPSDTVVAIANDLIHYGYVKGRVRIGIEGTEVSANYVYDDGVPAGILIASIPDDSPVKGTDVKEGDILTAIDGTEVYTFQNVYSILSEHKPGDKITLTLAREKE